MHALRRDPRSPVPTCLPPCSPSNLRSEPGRRLVSGGVCESCGEGKSATECATWSAPCECATCNPGFKYDAASKSCTAVSAFAALGGRLQLGWGRL